jgi:hypothetical protein
MLTLPIKNKWFDLIRSGEKKEEYREIKPYYSKRFSKIFGIGIEEGQMSSLVEVPWPETIIFRNGYSPNSPKIKCVCRLKIGQGREEWGAEPGKNYYILKIEDVNDIE